MTLIYRRPETGASASQLLWRGGFIFSLGLGYFVMRLQLTGAMMQVRRGDEGAGNLTFALSRVCCSVCGIVGRSGVMQQVCCRVCCSA